MGLVCINVLVLTRHIWDFYPGFLLKPISIVSTPIKMPSRLSVKHKGIYLQKVGLGQQGKVCLF